MDGADCNVRTCMVTQDFLNPAVAGDAPHHQREGLLASRPNEIEISNKEGDGYPAVIEKRLYMTFCIEYQVRIGSQVIRVHTSHSNVFKEGSRCFLTFKNHRWYEKESEALGKERTERQVI